jgi:hypothetical protein
VPLVLQWNNLGGVILPFLLSACLAASLAALLWKVGEQGGLVHRREACLGCTLEAALRKRGTCTEACAVNWIPTLPLALFFVTTALLILSVGFPWVVLDYVIPLGAGGGLSLALLGVVAGSMGGASVVLAGYFVQERARNRAIFLRVGAGATLAGVAGGLLLPPPWGLSSGLLTPLALWMLLLGLGLERWAREGRATLGIRALGLTLLPVFILVAIALARLFLLLDAFGGL